MSRKIITKKLEKEVIDMYLSEKFTTKYIANQKELHIVSVYNILRRNNIKTKYIGAGIEYVKSDKFKMLKLEELKILAQNKGGKLLSTEYLGARIKLTWECHNKHIFTTSPRVVLENKWCPECSSGLHEKLCRHAFETIFGYSFKKYKPNWLKSTKGYQMEIDGYCEYLNLGFEHNGKQHYTETKFFKLEKDIFKYRKQCDDLKYQLCNEHGINLIIIPPINIKIQLNQLKDFIITECKKLNIHVKNQNIEIDYGEVYQSMSKNLKQQERIEKIVKSKNGIIISGTYITCNTVYALKCNRCDNVWNVLARSLIKGSWCPMCNGINGKKNFSKKTEDEENIIIKLFKLHKKISKVSRETNIPRYWIRVVLKKHKLK